MIELLNQINEDVKNIFQYDIETTNAYVVPNRHDQGLTFPIGNIKKGKLIETCILFIDIRSSTQISKSLRKDKIKLGKIYSSFIHAMTSIADEYGYVRNIVGDRVMIVFEPNDCFVNAVNCAALMNTVSSRIIQKYSGLENFKVGIGIDYGEMLVLKTGIQKKFKEQSEYKGLVWVGDTANIASKLTDFAGKEYNSPLYNVTYEYTGFQKIFKGYKNIPNTSFGLPSLLAPKLEEDYEYKFEKATSTSSLNADDFNKKVEFGNEIKYDGKKVIDIKREARNGTASPILMSKKVYDEFKKADPKSQHLQRLGTRIYPGLTYITGGVYGGSPLYLEINQIKIG
ncbi:MAG: adenylate/guanylate cyclase domain-containing protein [Chitinophagales bacterium]|nr:adenylate/guanylate cyclase domain-containing protein [Chitinophagales bacterium]